MSAALRYGSQFLQQVPELSRRAAEAISADAASAAVVPEGFDAPLRALCAELAASGSFGFKRLAQELLVAGEAVRRHDPPGGRQPLGEESVTAVAAGEGEPGGPSSPALVSALSATLNELPALLAAAAQEAEEPEHGDPQQRVVAAVAAAIDRLRRAQGAPRYDAAALLRHAVDAQAPHAFSEVDTEVRAVRQRYQRGLIELLLGDPQEALVQLDEALAPLERQLGDSAAGAACWVARTTAQALAAAGGVVDREDKRSIAALDRELRRLGNHGAAAGVTSPSLLDGLLRSAAAVPAGSGPAAVLQALAECLPATYLSDAAQSAAAADPEVAATRAPGRPSAPLRSADFSIWVDSAIEELTLLESQVATWRQAGTRKRPPAPAAQLDPVRGALQIAGLDVAEDGVYRLQTVWEQLLWSWPPASAEPCAADLASAVTQLKRYLAGQLDGAIPAARALAAAEQAVLRLEVYAAAGPAPAAEPAQRSLATDAAFELESGSAPAILADALAVELRAEGDATEYSPAPVGKWQKGAPLRVDPSLLDTLVSAVGELASVRARLEQRQHAGREVFTALSTALERLSERLTDLEGVTGRWAPERLSPEAGGDTRMERVGALVRAFDVETADLHRLREQLGELMDAAEGLLADQAQLGEEVRHALQRVRLTPLATVVPRLRERVSAAAAEFGRAVEWRVEGEQTELDHAVLERLVGPLEQLLVNAVRHGIEPPEQRLAAGKPPSGTVCLALSRENGDVAVHVSDDGAGLDLDALQRQVSDYDPDEPTAALTPDEALSLIVAPGVSTLPDSAGDDRGVGLDLVASEVRSLGGSLDLHTEAGQGARFTLRLPVELALVRAVLCTLDGVDYAIPVHYLQGTAAAVVANGAAVVEFQGESYQHLPLVTLVGGAQGAEAVPVEAAAEARASLFVRLGEQRLALTVDAVDEDHEVVVKPLEAQAGSVPGLYSGSVLDDARVVLVLDLGLLFQRSALPPSRAEAKAPPRVLVVDDSPTLRGIAAWMLRRNGFTALTSAVAAGALQLARRERPDAVLVDLEMASDSAFELVATLAAEQALAPLGWVVVTTRPEHRERLRRLGIEPTALLVKPYDEARLLAALRAACDSTAVADPADPADPEVPSAPADPAGSELVEGERDGGQGDYSGGFGA